MIEQKCDMLNTYASKGCDRLLGVIIILLLFTRIRSEGESLGRAYNLGKVHVFFFHNEELTEPRLRWR